MATGMIPSNEPGPSFSEGAKSVGGGNIGLIGGEVLDTFFPARTTTVTNKSTQTNLTERAQQDMIYQMLSGQGGIATMGAAEASSGGYKSSSKAIGIADLISSTAAEIEKIKAPVVTTGQSSSKSKKSIICTALCDAGLMDRELYEVGQAEFDLLPSAVIVGYYLWAPYLAAKIPSNRLVTAVALYIVECRYNYVIMREFSLTGWLTVKIGEPICGWLGKFRSI